MRESGSEFMMVEDNHYDADLALSDIKDHDSKINFYMAKNGAEALDYLFAENGSIRVELPQVIFLDLNMPLVSGIDFLRKIKSNEETKKVPVMVLTSLNNPKDIDECKRLGGSGFIEKPLEYENFIVAIRNINQ